MSPSVPRALAGVVPGRIEAAVFVSGVASMGLEIVAGRQLAPSFGSSVYTWGGIIGVFLAALALGYWVAGRRARRRASRNALAVVFVGAAAYVALLLVLGEPLLTAVEGLSLPPRLAPLVPITVLFGPPTVLLGFISPYGAELIDAEGTGDASGRVYALGTAGSILGAFATTFLLVPAIGVAGIEFAYGVLMLGTALAVAPRTATPTWAAVAVVGVGLGAAFAVGGAGVGAGLGGELVYETQTQYQHLQVVDDGDVRTLYLDDVPHSAMDLTDPDRYVFEYTRYFHLAMLATGDVDRVLFVGGGGFSGPKRFAREYNATVEVVEIDPDVVGVAKRYFGVERRPEMEIHTGDGRRYLRETDRSYDVIVLDAYRADKVPYHLTTVEFMELVSARLDADGVVVANVISARTGEASAFYRAQYRTIDRVFPQVYSFPTSSTGALQNIELVATKDDTHLSEAEFARRNRERAIGLDLTEEIGFYRSDVPVGDAPLLRDDYAPVDSLLARQVDTRYVIERAGNATTTVP